MKFLKLLFSVLKQTFAEWNEDQVPRVAAALAYYTVFSIAPLLIVVIAIVGAVFSEDVVQTQVLGQVQRELGEGAAELVTEIIDSTTNPEGGIIATVVGVVALLLGALAVFEHMQAALNQIWDVNIEKVPSGIWGTIRVKLLSFGMLLVVGFLLLVSLVISTILAALDAVLVGLLPGVELLLQILSFLIGFAVITVLFAMLFKFLPQKKIEWREVWVGAAVSAALFSVGRVLLGLYLARAAPASAYGAAGSLVVILLWVYYSAQIVLFGAEFAQVYSRRAKAAAAGYPAPYTVQEDAAEDDTLPLTQIAQTVNMTSTTPEPEEATKGRERPLLPSIVFGVGTLFSGILASIVQAKLRRGGRTADSQEARLESPP